MPKTDPGPSDDAPIAAGRPPDEAGPRDFGHLRGLDGLRAIAVIAVVAYHAAAGVLPGGFLGVEVFFVISGYLITALLLAEHRATGRIDPINFWRRRARRLLPALFLLVGATMVFAVLILPDEIARLRADAIAAFAYVTNWHLIAGDQSYFDSIGRPSLLVHLWSLAIEEQFYVVWPLLLSLLLVLGRRLGLALTLVGAAASAVWMAVQFDSAADPSRLYYGTDTRLTGLLLGSALAYVWVPWVSQIPSVRPGMSKRKRRHVLASVAAAGRWGSVRMGLALDAIGAMALVGLGAFLIAADAFDPFVYQGGLAALATVTVVLIAAVVHPRGHLGRLLDIAPMRWVGTRSYSIYLWHWPVVALTRPGLDVPLEPVPDLVLRLALTALAAEASFRFIERPIRRAGLRSLITGFWTGTGEPVSRTRRLPSPALAGGLAAVLSVVLFSVATATAPLPPEGLRLVSINAVVTDPAAEPSDQLSAPTATGDPSASESHAGTPTGAPSASPSATPPPKVTPTPLRTILAFGESVMIQGAEALAEDLGSVRVDAAVGRHINEGIEILERRAADGQLANTVIVQLGNNGPFRAGQFDAAMAALRDVPRVVWVNVRVPRDWEAHNNRVIASGVSHYANARLVDWHAATEGRPDLFWKDGYHPRPKGARLYADLIAEAAREP